VSCGTTAVADVRDNLNLDDQSVHRFLEVIGDDYKNSTVSVEVDDCKWAA